MIMRGSEHKSVVLQQILRDHKLRQPSRHALERIIYKPPAAVFLRYHAAMLAEHLFGARNYRRKPTEATHLRCIRFFFRHILTSGTFIIMYYYILYHNSTKMSIGY